MPYVDSLKLKVEVGILAANREPQRFAGLTNLVANAVKSTDAGSVTLTVDVKPNVPSPSFSVLHILPVNKS